MGILDESELRFHEEFEPIFVGTELKLRCKLCGAVMDQEQTGEHRCPAAKRVS
jgi:hypothetical protein